MYNGTYRRVSVPTFAVQKQLVLLIPREEYIYIYIYSSLIVHVRIETIYAQQFKGVHVLLGTAERSNSRLLDQLQQPS